MMFIKLQISHWTKKKNWFLSNTINKWKINVINFISNKQGLIILKAFYGHQEKIKEILKKEKLKNIDVADLEDFITKETTEKIEHFNENDLFSEILDVRIMLQNFVKNSSLQFKFENLKKIPGIFNPCIEECNSPFLFIK